MIVFFFLSYSFFGSEGVAGASLCLLRDSSGEMMGSVQIAQTVANSVPYLQTSFPSPKQTQLVVCAVEDFKTTEHVVTEIFGINALCLWFAGRPYLWKRETHKGIKPTICVFLKEAISRKTALWK